MMCGSTALFLAAAYTAVHVNVSELPKDKAFVGDILADRIAAVRESCRCDGRTLEVNYALEPSLGGETAVVTVRNGKAEIRGARFRALLFGTGVLLKSIVWKNGSFELADGERRFQPAKTVRMSYAARHFLNWYMEAPVEEVLAYLEDLVLDGLNSFMIQYAMPVADLARASKEATAAFEANSRRIAAHIAALDCDYCLNIGGNQLPEDSPAELRGLPPTKNRTDLGFNACPSKPAAMQALLDHHRRELAKVGDVPLGYVCTWSYDEGGCGCDKCVPYGGKAYLGLCERKYGVYHALHPEAKTILTTWLFDDEDYDGLWKYLETHDWVDYLLCDAHEEYPRYPLEHKVPGRVKIITFPEISMWGRFPWGGFGAIMMPRRFERLFRQVEGIAAGCMYYDEGIYLDVNKAVVTGLYVDPKSRIDDLLRAYARWHFPGVRPDDFTRLAALLEANHLGKDLTLVRAREAKSLAEKMNGEIFPSAAKSWRWRLIYLRTLIDEAIVSQPGYNASWIQPWFDECVRPESLLPLLDELTSIYHAERQRDLMLANGHGGWTVPRYKPMRVQAQAADEPQLTELSDAKALSPRLLKEGTPVGVTLSIGRETEMSYSGCARAAERPRLFRHPEFDASSWPRAKGFACSAPVASYRGELTVPSQTEKHGRIALAVEGLTRGYYLWLDGKYVGFSRMGEQTTFDVTDLVRGGSVVFAIEAYAR